MLRSIGKQSAANAWSQSWSPRIFADHLYTVRQKKEPIFFCVYLFNAWQELVNFFTYIKESYKLQFRVFNFGMR